MKNQAFDLCKVFWEHNRFKPWFLTEEDIPKPLSGSRFSAKEEILVLENDGFNAGFLRSDAVYHHIVQGIINEKPFMLTFCVMCNAGVAMTPMVDGEYIYFEAVGVYNGQLLIQDLKTKSYWNHLTGDCLHGELKGKKLDVAYLKMTTAGEEGQHSPDLPIYRSKKYRAVTKVMNTGMNFLDFVTRYKKDFLPPFFAKTIIDEDKTFPRMTKGLAVKVGNQIKFYEIGAITTGMTDILHNGKIRFVKEQVPYVLNEEDKRPFQLFMRWYAFKINYPEGEVFISKA